MASDPIPLDVDRYRVSPSGGLDLSAHSPADTGPYGHGKKRARKDLEAVVGRLDTLQRVLWAQQKHKLLVVLQAMDTGGKDGAIRKVFGRLNPQGVSVTGFKVPTPRDLAHDYLWRVHPHTPGSGRIAVFNRSHYEDVLVVRVLGLVPEERWRPRYRHIVDFERLLADEGTTVLKFFLHISKEEQRSRLEARLANPDKRWKFNKGDLEHRELWDQYVEAYREALESTSTETAPWYVVPADHKWYRDMVIATTVANTLEKLPLAYPDPEEDLDGIHVV
jgi:PPK2 family polyphosphate:nucleotide phosphotransferase